MATISDIFRKSIQPFLSHGLQTAIALKSGISLSKINKIVTGELRGSEDDRRAIAAAIGYEYEDFLDIGRTALGLPAVAKGATVPPAPEVARCLDQARHILEGPKGAALKVVIDSMMDKHEPAP